MEVAYGLTVDPTSRATAMPVRPFVSVIVPARNEAAHIAATVRSLLDQTYPADRIEIIVADGVSDDRTWWVAEQAGDGRVDVIANVGRTAAAGLNAAIRAAKGDIIARLDGHATASPNYIAQGVRDLEATGAWSVGGMVERVVTNRVQGAIAAVTRSPVIGQANDDEARWVDTAAFGMWPRWVFDRVGLFDEEMVRNQDDELSLRIHKAGGRVWYDPAIRFRYVPRATVRGFVRQYRDYGFWKVRVFQKNRHRPSLRQLFPAVWVGSMVGSAVIGIFSPLGWPLLGGVALPYLGAVAYASRRPPAYATRPSMMLAYATMHAAYGAGFLAGLIRFGLRQRRVAEVPTL